MSNLVSLSAVVVHGGGIQGNETALVTGALCAIIRAVTASWACHVLLLVRHLHEREDAFWGCGRECAIEDGFTGLPDAVTRQPPSVGVSATRWPVRQASLRSNWTEIALGSVPQNILDTAFVKLRNVGFARKPQTWVRLALRLQTCPPSPFEYVCSTWVAMILVELGCLFNATDAWNAAPADFLDHRLSSSCLSKRSLTVPAF